MGRPSPLEPGQPNNTQTQTSVSPLLPQHTHSRHTQPHIWRVSRFAVRRRWGRFTVRRCWSCFAVHRCWSVVVPCSLRSCHPLSSISTYGDGEQRRQLGLALLLHFTSPLHSSPPLSGSRPDIITRGDPYRLRPAIWDGYPRSWIAGLTRDPSDYGQDLGIQGTKVTKQ